MIQLHPFSGGIRKERMHESILALNRINGYDSESACIVFAHIAIQEHDHIPLRPDIVEYLQLGDKDAPDAARHVLEANGVVHHHIHRLSLGYSESTSTPTADRPGGSVTVRQMSGDKIYQTIVGFAGSTPDNNLAVSYMILHAAIANAPKMIHLQGLGPVREHLRGFYERS